MMSCLSTSSNGVNLSPPPPLNVNRLQENPILHVQQLLLPLPSIGSHDRRRRRHHLHDIPERTRGILRIAHRREAAQHRGAEDDRRRVRTREHDGHVARVRQEAHERRVLGLRAREVERVDGVSRVVQLVDDVSGLKRDGLEGQCVFTREIVQRRVLERASMSIRE
jgi:hypothetical protein